MKKHILLLLTLCTLSDASTDTSNTMKEDEIKSPYYETIAQYEDKAFYHEEVE